MTPQILTVVTSTSGIIGFFSLLAYLYFHFQIKQITQAERSIKGIVEGDGLFNADQVLEILRDFKDEAKRIEALIALTNHSSESAQRIYDKIKGRIDVSQIPSKPNKASESASLAAASFFISLAILALIYSALSSRETPSQQQTGASTATQTGNNPDEKKSATSSQKQATAVEQMEVIWQKSVVTEGTKSYNARTFRVENKHDANIKNVDISIFVYYPYAKLDERSFFANTATCKLLADEALGTSKIQCEYVGVGGVIGFSLSSDIEKEFPSGEVVISNPDGTLRKKFGK